MSSPKTDIKTAPPMGCENTFGDFLKLKQISGDTSMRNLVYSDSSPLTKSAREAIDRIIFNDLNNSFTEVDNESIDSKDKAIERGLRYNSGKAKWALIDFPSLEPMVRVMEYGANKYAPHNWKKGMSHTEISECLLRHLFAYLGGEDIDPESGQSHIAHVQCNAMFLQYNIKNHPALDDRFKAVSKDGK